MKLIHHITHEHAELLPQIEHLKEAADAVGSAQIEVQRNDLHTAYEFLAHQLIPHALSEDEVLYPLIAHYQGHSDATDQMSYEHTRVVALTKELKELMNSEYMDTNALRHVLYSLHSLVLLHFDKEEKFFLPVLQSHLTTEDDETAAEAMHSSHRHTHSI